MIVLSTVTATLAVSLLIGLGVLYSGVYGVAADQPHTAAGRWLLETAKHRAIAVRADGEVPALTPEMAAAAADRYAQTCAHCHGAPGLAAADFAAHMRPEPPDLAHAADHMSPAELRWVIVNGLRMTGMPAFGHLLSDNEAWNLVALITRLPEMGRQDFQDLVASAAEAADGGPETAERDGTVQTLGPGAEGVERVPD